ncbi:MAG: rhamnulokinase [Lachnospiraceae bacterium]|jgi:rhamnulokinase
MKYYLAVDIGASSGRHILAHMENGRIVLEEMYRFANGNVEKNGHLCWEFDRLFQEIVNGIRACADAGKAPATMGIDTWGVDFVLLDEKDRVLGDTVAYRDSRTQGMDAELSKLISPEELYRRTGIQKAIFNSIYQFCAIKKEHPEYLEQAQSFLMTPDYFNFLLTGVKMNEYTIATTGQLVSASTNDWDYDLMRRVGIPTGIFGKLCMPGTVVGPVTDEIARETGCRPVVMLPASHDTGSAVLAVPANDDDFIYLSSGTWSLMGIERKTPDTSLKSMQCNFTNEGGYDHRFRYLKNIMGLWMLQSVRREMSAGGRKYTFPELIAMAGEADGFPSVVDVNDNSFLAPKSMTQAVKDYCAKSGQKVPETQGEVMVVIYNSLADSYRKTKEQLEEMTGRTYSRLHIVGGGCQDMFLNHKTKEATGLDVYAGPVEGTAIGNLMVQMLSDGTFRSLPEARACVAESFDVKRVD